MTTKSVLNEWMFEHFKLFFSHNDVESRISAFKREYPEISTDSVIFAQLNIQEVKRQFEHLQALIQTNDADVVDKIPDKVLVYLNISKGVTKERCIAIRKAIISLNLAPGEILPWDAIYERTKTYTKMPFNTMRSMVLANGGYEYLKGKGIFEDLVEMRETGNRVKTWIFKGKPIQEETKKPENDKSTIMVPARIVHKYDTSKKPDAFVDEDTIMVKTHDLHAEQVQLLKEHVIATNELVKVLKTQTDLLTRISNSISPINNTINNANTFILREIEKNTAMATETFKLFDALSKKKGG